MPRKQSPPPAEPARSGGYFVIARSGGRYWTGKKWSEAKEEALHYHGPLDPNGEARSLVKRFKATNTPCFLIYFETPSGRRSRLKLHPVT